ncbi:MAG: phosphate/phosphite/phosphonate ABC transporter substrate-binding protein [Pseudomonadota bacterium]
MRQDTCTVLTGIRKVSVAICLIFAEASAVSAAEKPWVMGIFPRRTPTETMMMFSPLAKYLSATLGREVKVETTPDYPSFADALASKRYDFVHFNQYQYIRSHRDRAYVAIAKNVENQSDTIRGLIIVRKDSGITKLQQLFGKAIVFGGDKHALVSYILPRLLLEQIGMKLGDYKEIFTPSPPNVPLAVFARRADAGGTGEPVFYMPAIAEKIDVGELTVLAASPPVAQLPWAVRSDMGIEDRNKLKKILTTISESASGRDALKAMLLTNITAATDAEYNDIRRIVRIVLNENY